MAGVVSSELAIAVVEAGGLGSLPCAMLSTGQVRAELAKIRQRTARPINGSGANSEFPIRIQCYFGGLGAGMSNGKGTKAMFAGRHFDREVILLCVRWYLRYKLSLRDLVEMMAERELELAHTTIMRWVQRYVPEFEKSWARYARKVGRSWRVDETYLKVRGDGSISTVPWTRRAIQSTSG